MVQGKGYKGSHEGMGYMVDHSMKRYCIFIGGVPGVGKSSISAEIASHFKIGNVLSGDYLREFYRAYDNATNIMGTSVYDAWKKYGEKNRENILKGFREQSSIMSPGITRIIKRSSKNGEMVIMETLYFLPSLYSSVLEETIPLYLFVKDGDIHASKLNERTKYTHFRSPGERLSSHLNEYRIMMEESISECKDHGIRIIDTTDYNYAVNDSLRYIGDFLEL